ncbi:MAG: hypothetical protein ABR606_10155, partial [Vicinamibacterales bacterium]
MTRIGLSLLVCSLSLAACSQAADRPDSARPARSGLDLTLVDKTVRPQDDLFAHVNGGWLAKTEIPPDKASYGTFDVLQDKAQVDLRAIIEDAAKAPNKTPGADAQKIGDFYASFMDEARADSLGGRPIATELAAIDALETKPQLARYFARAFKLNVITPLVGG